MKPLKGFNGRGVMEVVADKRNSTFREVYTLRFDETIYVMRDPLRDNCISANKKF